MKVKVTVLVSFMVLLSSCKFHHKTKNYYEIPPCSDSYLSDQNYIQREIQKICETIPPLLELLPESSPQEIQKEGCFFYLMYERPTKKEECPALALIDNKLFSYDWIDDHLDEKSVEKADLILAILPLPFNQGITYLQKEQCDMISSNGGHSSKYYSLEHLEKLKKEASAILRNLENQEMSEEQIVEALDRFKALFKDKAKLLKVRGDWDRGGQKPEGYDTVKKEVIEISKEINSKVEAFKTEVKSLQGVLEKQSQECDKILAKHQDVKGCRVGDTPYDKIYIQMDCRAVKKADDDIKSVLKSMNESDLKQLDVGETQKILRTFLKLTGKQK